jgi:hypothetical protein
VNRHTWMGSQRNVRSWPCVTIRSGSIKRVAAAVCEGAQVAAALHAYLAQAAGDAVAPATVGRL